MKIKLFIIFIIVFQFACENEKSELERSWILVKNEAKPNAGFIPVLRGQLFHFNKDKFYISHLSSNEEKEENYFLQGEYVKTDSTTVGKILHLSKDSLIIEADTNSYDMHFRPLEDVVFSQDDKEKIFQQLISNPWNIYDKQLEGNYKLYCSDKNWEDKHENIKWTNRIVYEKQFEDDKWLSEYEWWALKEFKGKLLFCFTKGLSTEIVHFQILDYNEDNIEGKFMNWLNKNWTENQLEKVALASDSKIELDKKFISGKWKINNLIKPNPKEINLLRDSFDASGVGKVRFENRISISDLEQENLKFQFSPKGKYKILAGEKTIRKGDTWGTTKDGHYLFLDSDLAGENFIELLSLEENQLKIKFWSRIGLTKISKTAFAFVELEIELRKEDDTE